MIWKGQAPKVIRNEVETRRESCRQDVLDKLDALEIEVASRARHGMALRIQALVDGLTGVTRALPAHEVWGEDIRNGVQRWTVELQELVQEMARRDDHLERLLTRGEQQ